MAGGHSSDAQQDGLIAMLHPRWLRTECRLSKTMERAGYGLFSWQEVGSLAYPRGCDNQGEKADE